jgi:hypothetical protein
MKTFIRAALAAAALLSCAPAFAADNFVVKDANGVTITKRSKDVSGVQHEYQVMEGLFSGTPTPLCVDASGNLCGLATATLQGTSNTKLDSIITNTTGGALASKQDTGNASLGSIDTKVSATNTKLDTLHADMIAPTPGGTNVIGDVGSASFSANCTVLTLPGTGGTYASGDLVANNATAGSVTPLSCVVGRYSGGPVTITKARLLTSTTGLSLGSFRVHAYTASPTVTNGNDGVFLSTASGHFCKIDVTLDVAFSDGAEGFGQPYTGSTCTRVLSATQTVYVLVEARSAYAWTAAQTVTVTLEGFN